jgi:hypothetical protein
MILVAATAVAFAFFRQQQAAFGAFSTFGGNWEGWLFVWMKRCVPFPAMGSLAVVAIAFRDRKAGRGRWARSAGVAGCCAASAAMAITALIACSFYAVHVLEDARLIRKVFSHGTGSHLAPPFGNTPMEEIVGAAVLGSWAALALGRRWRAEPSWVDRLGRCLGLIWIGLFLIYLYAYAG